MYVTLPDSESNPLRVPFAGGVLIRNVSGFRFGSVHWSEIRPGERVALAHVGAAAAGGPPGPV